MTRRQLDLYVECNRGQAPEEIFREACCVRCVNPECSRSMYGKTRFEDRVQNWHERLFANVPRMDQGDDRFGKIAGQRFILIDPSSPGTPGDWVDPRDLETKTTIQVPRSFAVKPPASPEPAPTPVADVPQPTVNVPVELATVNTPVKSGQMLPQKSPEKPAAGEWVTPAAPTPHQVPDAQVIKSGARIKIGS